METRKIVIVSSKEQKKYVINSAATTLGELKSDLMANDIDYSDCSFLEGISKTEFTIDEAILPHDVPYKGQTTNNLVFMLTANKKKIASGAYSRKELYGIIKEGNLQAIIKEKYYRNYTNLSTDTLQDIVNSYVGKTAAPKKENTDGAKKSTLKKKEVPAKKEVDNNTSYVSVKTFNTVITKLVRDINKEYVVNLYPSDYTIEDDGSITSQVEEEKALKDSPYSADEINGMFN